MFTSGDNSVADEICTALTTNDTHILTHILTCLLTNSLIDVCTVVADLHRQFHSSDWSRQSAFLSHCFASG